MTDDTRSTEPWTPDGAQPVAPAGSYWELPAEPAEPAPAGPPAPTPFGKLSTNPGGVLAAAFDVLAGSSGELRRASFYIGLIVLGLAAPLGLLTWRIFTELVEFSDLSQPAFTPAAELVDSSLGASYFLAVIIGVAGLIVASIESRAIGIAVLAARLGQRRLELRDAVQRSRTTFWRLFAAVLVAGIPLAIVQSILQESFGAFFGRDTEAAALTSSLLTAVLFAPLAYVQAGVVIGDVGPLEAIRRSFRLFRARRAVAMVVALFEFGSQFLTVFGLFAGLDLVVRFVDAAGLGLAGDATAIAITVGLIVILLFAVGTLIFTVAAISVAPQVVAFLALTHAAPGLERIGGGSDGRRFRWLTRPMLVGMIVAAVSLLAGFGAFA